MLAKIRTISRSHVVRSGLQVFRDRKEGQEIKLTKADVPGLGEYKVDSSLLVLTT